MRLPGVCIDCRTPVVYDGFGWHDRYQGREDTDRLGRSHNCIASPTMKAHNAEVGVSDTPPHETARLPLTPVVAGPSQPRVESAR